MSSTKSKTLPKTKIRTHIQGHRITSYNVCYTKLLRQTPPNIDLTIETRDKIASNVEEQSQVEETFEKPAKSEKITVEAKPVKRILVQPVITETQAPELFAIHSPVPEQIKPIRAEVEPVQMEISKLQVPSVAKELVPKQATVRVRNNFV